MNVVICCFSSGLDDMKRKDQRDVVKVLRILSQCGRFSVFEATENQTIARMMDNILHKGCTIIGTDGIKKTYGILAISNGGDFPWTNIELTSGGRQLLEDNAV